ncbi:MAG TPA: hypothetical protein VM118_10325 [Acidobacteriota bacterium]|nr:hypothetical protein [Acidobacteriota bacterium]
MPSPIVHLIFATFVASPAQLDNALILAESVRSFAGQYRESPVWVYMPHDAPPPDVEKDARLKALKIEIKHGEAPEEARWFYYADKVFAAADAERLAEGHCAVLVWMDDDTIILREPTAFVLDTAHSFGYVPVMHNRSGTLYGEPSIPFWKRVFEKLAIDDDKLFAMTTIADRQVIRAYFHVGLMVVRPEAGVFRLWAKSFRMLYEDLVLAEMCRADAVWRIFIHQAALVSVLNLLGKEQMIELPGTYNYPLFFEKVYDSDITFGSIENVVTLRHEAFAEARKPGWSRELKGPAQVIAWLKEHLGGDQP